MFCTNCGTNVDDQAPFCTNCGTDLRGQAQPAQPTQAANNNVGASAKQAFSNIGKNFSGDSMKGMAKNNKLMVTILACVCVALLVFSYFATMGKSFEKIPAVSLIMGNAADEFDDMREEWEDGIEELEENLEEIEDELSKKETKAAKDLIKQLKKCAKSFSIRNLKGLTKSIKAADDIDDLGAQSIAGDVADGLDDALKVISTIVLISMLFALAFSACGGFLKIRALVIVGMIFSIIHALIFCGFLFVLLFAASHIALFIFIGKLKAETKAVA